MSAEGSRKFYVIMLLLTFLTLVCIKGCDDDGKSGLPTNNQQAGLSMSIFANPETQAKLTGLTLDVVGLNEAGQPSEPRLSRTISDVNLPVTIPLTLYDPPCRYQGTVTAHLTREAPRVVSREFNICQQSRVTIKIDTFEGFWIANNPIQAPASVNAGAAVDVVCGTDQIDAPDKDRYPLSATLSEQDGSSASGPFDVNVAVAGSFPDPYPLTSAVDQRHFTCVISDGHSRPQTFTASVARIPATPSPSPTPIPPTVTPTPPAEDPEPPAPAPPAPGPQPTTTGTPTVTPMPTVTPTGTPTVTPTPTPTGTPTVTPMPTVMPTGTPTVTPTPTPTGTPTATPTPTPTMPPMEGLYRYYSDLQQDHMDVDSSVSGPTQPTIGSYSCERTLGYIFETQTLDTIPLYRNYNHSEGIGFDHMSTTDKTELNEQGWPNEGILGYIYPPGTSKPGTVPLYWKVRDTSTGLGIEHVTTNDANEGNSASPPWTNPRLLGYAIGPSSNSCP